MDLDEDDRAARGLLRYVRLVGHALGMGSVAAVVQLDEPLGVYLPLDRCVAEHDDCDLALVWDERRGWALAVESGGGVDLRMAGFLGDELVPAPEVVAAYVDRACRGDGFGAASAPELESAGLAELLARYDEHDRPHAPKRPLRRPAPLPAMASGLGQL